MPDMDEFVRWLRAQLDEDERIALAATWCEDAATWHAEPSPYDARGDGQRWYVEDAMDNGVVTHVDPAASDDMGVAQHIAAHDPAQALREVEADRALLDAYAAAQESVETVAHPDMYDVGRAHGLEEAVRYRALRYTRRDGYREEWRP